jgi:hypothetical protein
MPSWPQERARLHGPQLAAAAPDRRLHAVEFLADAAATGYAAAFPGAELVTFTVAGIGFLFDHSTSADRASRTVAAWTHARAVTTSRDRSRQARFPLAPALAGAGYERGHLIAHATGGQLDANLFAQARHVNQGRSPDGRRYRQLERLAAANPGCLVFHRLIYGDGSDVPDLTELTIVIGEQTHRGVFDNRPDAWAPATAPLRRGRRFHHQVQTTFLLGLASATAHPEHHVTLGRTSRGRVDLHVVPDLGEHYAVVVEIKSTDWDTLPEHRVRPNLRAHLRQLQRYLDRYIDDMHHADDRSAGNTGAWDSVSGVLLYPRRPINLARLQLIDELTSREAIMVAWYDEADWASRNDTLDSMRM